jgi:hypothetical protein
MHSPAPSQEPTRAPTKPFEKLPAEIVGPILSELEPGPQRESRLVCHDRLAASPSFRSVVCHQDARTVDSLAEKGLWARTQMIAGGWSLGYSDELVSSLTRALTEKTKIDIRCLGDACCGCCPPADIPGILPLENTTFWALLTAVSRVPPRTGQLPLQIRRFELSRTWRESVQPILLTAIRSLLSAHLASLEVFMYAYPHAIAGHVDEGEQDPFALASFLHECPQLTTLYLHIDSFADLPNVNIPNLRVLRVGIRTFDDHLLGFLDRHKGIEELYISILPWKLSYSNDARLCRSRFAKCHITNASTDPWTGRRRTPRGRA